MRLKIEAGAKISSITIFNKNDQAANMQVRAMRWNQDNEAGGDNMEETKELIFFPKIFSLPAHGQKVIRVGYQGKTLSKELAFRLFIRELPVDEPGRMGMKFAVRMSMPVFIRPKGAIKPGLPSVTGIEIHEGKLAVRVQNRGAVYFMMNGIDATGSKAGKEVYSGKGNGWYVLAGASKLFKLDISRSDCNRMDMLKLVANSRAGKGEASFPVDHGLCAGIKQAEAETGADAEK